MIGKSIKYDLLDIQMNYIFIQKNYINEPFHAYRKRVISMKIE